MSSRFVCAISVHGKKCHTKPVGERVTMYAGENNHGKQDGLAQHQDGSSETADDCAPAESCSGARGLTEKAALSGYDEPGAYLGLGRAALQKKQLEDAEAAFKVALRLDQRCAKAYRGLATVYQEWGNFAEAFEMYLKSLELDSLDLTALSGLFKASCKVESFSQVRHYLEAYLSVHSDDAKVMFCLAALHIKDGRLDRAKQVLTKVLTLAPAYTAAADLLEEVEHELAQEEQTSHRCMVEGTKDSCRGTDTTDTAFFDKPNRPVGQNALRDRAPRPQRTPKPR